MKRKRLLTLLGSVCLAVMLLVPLAVSCGPATPEAAEEEIAALESEIDELEGDVSAKDAEISDLEDEIAALKKPAEVIRWRFQSYDSPESLGPYLEFCDKIKRSTDGQIEIEYFPSGALVPAAEQAAAVRDGTLDLTLTWGDYHKGLIPVGEVEAGLPMSWGNIHQAQLFFNVYGAREIIREAYAEHNIYWVTNDLETGCYALLKKPVTKLEDMTDLKFRCTAGIGELLGKFDIPTVYLPAEELYTSMATGIIDAVIYGTDGDYYSMKLHEQAKYVVNMQLLDPYTSAILLNMDEWNALPDDLKGIFQDAAIAHFTISYWEYWLEQSSAAKEAGVFEYLNLAPEDVKKLTEAALVMWDEVAAKSPRCAELIELLKKMNRGVGRL